jgi:hypothetical protein
MAIHDETIWRSPNGKCSMYTHMLTHTLHFIEMETFIDFLLYIGSVFGNLNEI